MAISPKQEAAIALFCECDADGRLHSIVEVCELAGFTRALWYRWIKNDEDFRTALAQRIDTEISLGARKRLLQALADRELTIDAATKLYLSEKPTNLQIQSTTTVRQAGETPIDEARTAAMICDLITWYSRPGLNPEELTFARQIVEAALGLASAIGYDLCVLEPQALTEGNQEDGE